MQTIHDRCQNVNHFASKSVDKAALKIFMLQVKIQKGTFGV